MSLDMLFVMGLIVVAGALMASGRIRNDLVALLVVLALMLSGVLTVPQAIGGFGSPVVALAVCMLLVGEILARTGVAAAVGDLILRRGGENEARLLVLIMLAAALLGAFMSSTAIVAVFIPIILRIAANTPLSASRLLLPMSYAALISGMLTLIATTPNIVVHEELKGEGFEGFGFFGFTAIGVCVLLSAVVYMLLIGRRLLPRDPTEPTAARSGRQMFELWRSFNTADDYGRATIGPGSPLVGQAVGEAALERRYGVRIAGIETGSASARAIVAPNTTTRYAAGDVVLFAGRAAALERLAAEQELTLQPHSDDERRRWLWEIGGASVLIHPDATLKGQTVRQAEFHARYRLQVLGMRRGNEIIEDYADTPLAAADSLFVVGPWARIKALSEYGHEFVLLEVPTEIADVVPERRKMRLGIGILVAMVLLVLLEVVPILTAAFMAMLAGIFTRCLTMEDAYRAIPWSTIVLIAGMLPLADALTATGGTQLIVNTLLGIAGEAGPRAMLTLLFFLTATLGLILSNTASAVLVAPIAIYAAGSMGVSPYPFAVAVLIAASSAFSTPVSTPVVTLVVDPGRYRFTDFVKLGVPLLLITYTVTVLIAPLIFPF